MENEQTTRSRILIIQTGGDTALSAIQLFIKTLRQLFPNASLTLMNCSPTPMSKSICVDHILPWRQTDSPLTVEMLNRHIAILSNQTFNAAFILTLPQESPYFWGYLCYLTNIPIRVGFTTEFGGSVLSHAIEPEHAVFQQTTHPYLPLLSAIQQFSDGVLV